MADYEAPHLHPHHTGTPTPLDPSDPHKLHTPGARAAYGVAGAIVGIALAVGIAWSIRYYKRRRARDAPVLPVQQGPPVLPSIPSVGSGSTLADSQNGNGNAVQMVPLSNASQHSGSQPPSNAEDLEEEAAPQRSSETQQGGETGKDLEGETPRHSSEARQGSTQPER